MKLIKTVEEWRAVASPEVGFVPTMGNLHQGHQSLLKRCREENKVAVLSIYVNPTQFNDPQDFKNYPKTLEQDLKLAEAEQFDFVFMPAYEDLYPDQYRYQIFENQMSSNMEGAVRPGHFTGMLTVVLKLLNIIRPRRAYFGEKDYQQLQLIRGLAQAFFLPTEIIACATIRNEQGLALSSRNHLLSPSEFELAQQFPKIFHSKQSCDEIKDQLKSVGFEVDYVEEVNDRRFAAVRVGKVRLIDNYGSGGSE